MYFLIKFKCFNLWQDLHRASVWLNYEACIRKMHAATCVWALDACFCSSSNTEGLPLRQEKGQKWINWVAPLGCSAAACFHGNRGVWLAARPCNVESRSIKASINIHTFLPQSSHPHCQMQRLTLGGCTVYYTGMPIYGRTAEHIITRLDSHVRRPSPRYLDTPWSTQVSALIRSL